MKDLPRSTYMHILMNPIQNLWVQIDKNLFEHLIMSMNQGIIFVLVPAYAIADLFINIFKQLQVSSLQTLLYIINCYQSWMKELENCQLSIQTQVHVILSKYIYL